MGRSMAGLSISAFHIEINKTVGVFHCYVFVCWFPRVWIKVWYPKATGFNPSKRQQCNSWQVTTPAGYKIPESMQIQPLARHQHGYGYGSKIGEAWWFQVVCHPKMGVNNFEPYHGPIRETTTANNNVYRIPSAGLKFFLQWKALYSQRLVPANPAIFSGAVLNFWVDGPWLDSFSFSI